MKRHVQYVSVFALSVGCLSLAMAADFNDWVVACDNTRHCEAVGYQAETADHPVALWLARDAGPNAPITLRLRADLENGDGPPKVNVVVGDKTIEGIETETDIDAAKVAAMLPQMLNAPSARVTDGQHEWTLSLAGVKAALLKMDDEQGRVGTPGAIVRKGSQPESSVKPPLPVPQVKLALWPGNKAVDDTLVKAAIKEIEDPDCEMENAEISATRLSERQMLILRECALGAYQAGYHIYIANLAAPHQPRAVALPTPTGEPTGDIGNGSFEDGILSSYYKGRGVGDCGSGASWAWDGRGFVQIEGNEAPLCRGMAGGGFSLRTWIAHVQK